MKIIAIVTAVVICKALIHEFGEFVDDVIPDSHKAEVSDDQARS